MSHPTRLRQVRTGDPRQIFRPNQLVQGAEIALVEVQRGTPLTERTAAVAYALTAGAFRGKGEGWAHSVRRAWRHTSPGGLAPQIRGIVGAEIEFELGTQGRWIEITGRPEGPLNLVQLDPANLPAVTPPFRSAYTYGQLGLLPEYPEINLLEPGLHVPGLGRWRNLATLVLSQPPIEQ